MAFEYALFSAASDRTKVFGFTCVRFWNSAHTVFEFLIARVHKLKISPLRFFKSWYVLQLLYFSIKVSLSTPRLCVSSTRDMGVNDTGNRKFSLSLNISAYLWILQESFFQIRLMSLPKPHAAAPSLNKSAGVLF